MWFLEICIMRVAEGMSVRQSVMSQSILLSCALSSSCPARSRRSRHLCAVDSLRDFDVVCSSCLFLPPFQSVRQSEDLQRRSSGTWPLNCIPAAEILDLSPQRCITTWPLVNIRALETPYLPPFPSRHLGKLEKDDCC